MKKMILAATILGAVLFGEMANAQPGTRNFNRREANETIRINQGVRHGDLNMRETRQLMMQKRQIQQMKRMAMADGYISPRERMMLANAQNRLSNNIYMDRHNGMGRRW